MSEKRNQVNVRLSDDENEMLTQVSNSLGISKSEVIRLSLADNLMDATSHKKLMSREDRQKLMGELAGVVNELNDVRYEVNKVGVNVNQIAKRVNKKFDEKIVWMVSRVRKDFSGIESKMSSIDGVVMKIWQSLV